MEKSKNKNKNQNKIAGKLLVTAVIFVFLSFSFFQAHAAVNKMINYQGKLTSTTGWAVPDGSYDMRFKLYDAATSGSLLWTGTHTAANGNTVAVSRGIFSILLGSGAGNALTIDFSSDTYYLQVEIYNTNTSQWETFNNRKRIGSVPQAINALNVIGDGNINISNTSPSQSAASITYNPGSGTNSAMDITYGSGGGTGTALKVTQAGTGYAATFFGGNVGIGTTSPGRLLDINGVTRLETTTNNSPANGDFWYIAGHLYFYDSTSHDLLAGGSLPSGSTGQTLYYTGSAWTATSNLYNNGTNIGIGTTVVGGGKLLVMGGNVGVGTTSPSQLFQVNANGSFAIVLTSGGNVGIGITSPTAKLDIRGGIAAGTNSTEFTVSAAGVVTGGTYNGVTITGNGTLTTGSGSYNLTIPKTGTAVVGTGTIGYNAYWTDANTLAVGIIWDNGTNVGIGTTVVGGGKLLVMGGNVGIGTTSPLAKLAIHTSYTNTAVFARSPDLLLQNDSNTVGNTTDISNQNSNGVVNAQIQFKNVDQGYKGAILFNTRLNVDTYLERMRIDESGNVGIGTTSPTQAALTVNGNMATLAQGDMLFYDTDNTNFTGFQAAGTTTANVVYTLPGAGPASDGYALTSTTGGTLSWSAASGGYNLIQEDGAPLTQRTTLNFTGTAVTCSDTGSITQCAISGSGGGVSFATGTPDNTTGSNNLIHLQKSGVDKFVVNNNGGLAIDADTLDIAKTTTGTTRATDFSLTGSTLNQVTSANDLISVDDTVATGIPNSGQGLASAPGTTTTNINIGAGSHTILRDDGKFVIIHGGGSLTASVWDGTTTGAMSALAQNVGIGSTVPTTGAISLKRPDGKYLLVSGTGSSATVFDPNGITAPAAGPTGGVCAVAGDGTNAFLRPDGKYVIMCGGSTAWGVYDPVANTYVGGTPVGSNFATGAFAIQRDDNTFLIFLGGGTKTHYIYNSATNTMSTVNPMGTGTEVPTVTTGAFAIRRNDGKFIIFPGAQYTSHLYDPTRTSANSGAGTITQQGTTIGWGPSAALGLGASAMWRQDGKYYVVIGNGSTATNIYDPSKADNTQFTTNSGTGLLPNAAGAGFHMFMRPNGQYAIIRGGGTAVDNYDMGFVMGGSGTGPQSASYETECIDTGATPALNASSSLNWNINGEGKINVQVKLSTAADCSSGSYKDIPNSGDLIRPSASPERYIRVKAFFLRDMPKFVDQEWGLRRGVGQVRYRRTNKDPALYDVTIDNSAVYHRNQFDLGMGGSGGSGTDDSGPIAINLTNSPGGTGLTLTPGQAVPLVGATINANAPNLYNGAFATHPPMNVGIGTTAATGTIVIRRSDGKYMKISGGTQSAEVYDATAQTWTNQTASGAGYIPAGTASIGALAIKRPDGKYLLVHGGAANTTSIYDPTKTDNTQFVAGPTLSAVAGRGALAIPLPDGRILIIHGNFNTAATGQSSIYDPINNTMVAGPNLPAGVFGDGSVAIPRPDGTYFLVLGNSAACTLATTTATFDPYRMAFTVNPATAPYQISTGTGPGAHAFQRADGMWVIVHGGGTASTCAGTARTQIYNPITNRTSVGPVLSAVTAAGSNSIQRPDGTWLTLHGGILATTSIYQERAGTTESVANAESPGTNTGIFVAGPTTPQNISIGSVSFQRDDGKYVVIGGGTTSQLTAVHLYDGGWANIGTYRSEAMNIPNLSSASALVWKATADPRYISAEVRTADTQNNLQVASFHELPTSGGLINPGGSDVWMQVNFNFRRTFSSLPGIYSDAWFNGGGAMSYNLRQFASPTLKEFKVANNADMFNLKADGLSMFRVSSSGDIYTSNNGSVNTGGADLAENYTSLEPLEKGAIVSVDPTDNHNVKQSTYAYQKDLLGVVSTAPGFVAGTYTEDSYPIALVGRVPVNVSNENGTIRSGDRITSASVPGYGMRATQAGRVIGVAMEDMDPNNLQACPTGGYFPNAKCGQIMVFVNLADYSGMPVSDLMAESEAGGMTFDADNALPSVLKTNPTDVQSPLATDIGNSGRILDFLNQLKDSEKSQISTDMLVSQLSASKSVISPLIVADTIIAKNIKADQIEGLEFIQTGIADAQSGVENNTSEVKSLGAQIADLQSAMQNMTTKSSGLDASTTKEFTANGGLTVGGPAEFQGPAVFKAVVEFMDKVIFHNNVEFAGQVMFNQDTAGYAIIKKGTQSVAINFSQEYPFSPPVVNASLSLQQYKDSDVRAVAESLLLISDVKYIITNVTSKGFEIMMDRSADSDIPFSWQAVAVKDPKTFEKDTAENSPSASPNVDASGSVGGVVSPSAVSSGTSSPDASSNAGPNAQSGAAPSANDLDTEYSADQLAPLPPDVVPPSASTNSSSVVSPTNNANATSSPVSPSNNPDTSSIDSATNTVPKS